MSSVRTSSLDDRPVLTVSLSNAQELDTQQGQSDVVTQLSIVETIALFVCRKPLLA
jgi:hypothetical protein